MDRVRADETFDQWCVLELMGRRRLAGKVTEQVIGGAGFLRIDVYPGPAAEPISTQYYAPGSVYAITPVSEMTARRFAVHNQPAPVTRWELPSFEGVLDSEIGDEDVDLELDDAEDFE